MAHRAGVGTFLLLGSALAMRSAAAPGPIDTRASEDAAAKAVEDLGGTVGRDEGAPRKPVTLVVLRGNPKVTDALLKKLRSMPDLRWLDLSDTGVTDAGLQDVAALVNLERLRLDGTKVTDAGLSKLKGLRRLREISLTDTKVTDAALADIGRLEELGSLDLSSTA